MPKEQSVDRLGADRSRPRIAVTVSDIGATPEPETLAYHIGLCVDSMTRHGADVIVLDPSVDAAARQAAFATMDGLLITGGADLDPARYGEPMNGSKGLEPDRDELEAAAWSAADARGVPVLGICRGFQAMNVFAGGTLIQHVEGHDGPDYLHDDAVMHPLRVAPGSRLAGLLAPGAAEPPVFEVNSYHHQAVGPETIAPGFIATAWAASPIGDLVEGLEAPGERFVVGIQTHPEQTGTTPPEFERLFVAFVDASRETRA